MSLVDEYHVRYDGKRPYAAHPALEDGDANDLWVNAAWACSYHADDNGTADMSQEEICLAVSASMAGEIQNGGSRQWLLYNMARPDLAAHAVQALHCIGSHGMAGFIERLIDACLGAREAWTNLPSGQWKGYQERRENLIEKQNASIFGVAVKTSLEKLHMNRDEFLAFLFDCERKFSETGETAEYQKWYDSHASNPKAPSLFRQFRSMFASVVPVNRPALAGSLYIDAGSARGGMYCFPFTNPFETGTTGFWYWENEFHAKVYEYTVRNIAKVRRQLQKPDYS